MASIAHSQIRERAVAGALSVLRDAVNASAPAPEWIPRGDACGRCWWLRLRDQMRGTVGWCERLGCFRAELASGEVDRFRTLRQAAEWLLGRCLDEEIRQGLTRDQRRRLLQLHARLIQSIERAPCARSRRETLDLAFFVGCLDAFFFGDCHIGRVLDCARKCGYVEALALTIG